MDKADRKIKALILLSGGLDSILAAKLLIEQNIEVKAVAFYSNFFDTILAAKAAKQLGIPLRKIDLREEFLHFLKQKPKYGYGVGLNPCIDCHILMLKKAGEIMKNEGLAFVATGEVLGERPMSQNKQALEIIEKESELKGYLLRPLSAKLLEETEAEKGGLVDREKLTGISGRNRQGQFALAKKFGIINFPTPAGGCMLTQGGFINRLKELMENKPDFNSDDVDLVKIGRHFWPGNVQVVLGRNKEENKLIMSFANRNDMIIEPENFVGPTALVCLSFPVLSRAQRGISPQERYKLILDKAKDLIIEFSPKAKNVGVLQFHTIKVK